MTNEPSEVSHKDIYDRLIQLEDSVTTLRTETADMIAAFKAAQGAFKVLEWIAKVAKPILIVGGFLAAIAAAYNHKL
jgi:hypothetical protein